MKLIIEPYIEQVIRWPRKGRHILGYFDEQSVVVYQAYNRSIANFATSHNYFGGDFKFDRMSWIKPNFLWMMYRSGWGTKPGQEVILAIQIKRSAFDLILDKAVHSTFIPGIYQDEVDWKSKLQQSLVRLQWDPDHHPSGAKIERRAIQLGLRGDILAQFARDWIIEIEDISLFVQQQRQYALSQAYEHLAIPREDIYPVSNPILATRLDLSIT